MMQSFLNYSGKVTIKVKSKPPIKSFNSGTNALFNSLCNIIARNLSDANSDLLRSALPSYMMIVSALPSDDVTNNFVYTQGNNLLLTEIPVNSRVVGSSTSVTLTSILTHSNIYSSRYDSTAEGYILLLDGDRENILAYTNLSLADIKEVVEDSYGQASIQWEMSFQNKAEENN